MRNAQRWMLLIVAWSVAAACVVPRGSVSWPESGAPAPDPTRRLELQGFSIMPPGGGERWSIPGAAVVHADRASFPPTPPLTVPLESVAAGQLFFSKRADLKDASHTIVAGVVTLDGKGAGNATDLQKQVAAEVAMPIGTRYRLVRSDVSVDVSLGPNCVRYETAKEDQDVPGFPGIVFLTTARAHRCLHPQWPRYAIEVVYTERRRQGQEPVAVDAEVETFLGSLRFTPDRPVLVTTIFVGKSPNDVAVGDGDVWVTNFSDDTVSRIDVRTNQVVATIPVGRRPVGVTLGEEAVWIANREDDTISRIDRRTNRVVATIPVGKGPGLVRFGAGAVWVVNFGSGTVSRVDPRRIGQWLRSRSGPTQWASPRVPVRCGPGASKEEKSRSRESIPRATRSSVSRFRLEQESRIRRRSLWARTRHSGLPRMREWLYALTPVRAGESLHGSPGGPSKS